MIDRVGNEVRSSGATTGWPVTRRAKLGLISDKTNSVFVEDAEYRNPEISLQPHKVEIEIEAVGVNIRDDFVQLSKITDERQLGCECAGVLRRLGSAAEAKRALLQDRYGLPDDQILFSRDTSFQRHIMSLTGGRSVEVVLDSLAGDDLVAS
ncbi:hypothetical protein N7540_007731 [Penicillium herquei]|nr:hypothetical protein N7540_007731 [Penicillium herquei]